MSVRVACLAEELKFVLETYLGWLRCVDCLNALYHLVVILFDQYFRSEIALVIKLRLAYAANVLVEVLPQCMCQCLDVLALPELLHNPVPALNALVVVQPALFTELIRVRVEVDV